MSYEDVVDIKSESTAVSEKVFDEMPAGSAYLLVP